MNTNISISEVPKVYIAKTDKNNQIYFTYSYGLQKAYHLEDEKKYDLYFSFKMYNNEQIIPNFAYYNNDERILFIIYDNDNDPSEPFDEYCLNTVIKYFENKNNYYDNGYQYIEPKSIKMMNIAYIINNISKKYNTDIDSISRYTSWDCHNNKFRFNIRFTSEHQVPNINDYYTNQYALKMLNINDIKEDLKSLFTNIDALYEFQSNYDKLEKIISSLEDIDLYRDIFYNVKRSYLATDVINTNLFIKNLNSNIVKIYNSTSDDDLKFKEFKSFFNMPVISESIMKELKFPIKRKTLNVRGLRFTISDVVTYTIPPLIDRIKQSDSKYKLVYSWLKYYKKVDDLKSLIQTTKLEAL